MKDKPIQASFLFYAETLLRLADRHIGNSVVPRSPLYKIARELAPAVISDLDLRSSKGARKGLPLKAEIGPLLTIAIDAGFLVETDQGNLGLSDGFHKLCVAHNNLVGPDKLMSIAPVARILKRFRDERMKTRPRRRHRRRMIVETEVSSRVVHKVEINGVEIVADIETIWKILEKKK